MNVVVSRTATPGVTSIYADLALCSARLAVFAQRMCATNSEGGYWVGDIGKRNGMLYIHGSWLEIMGLTDYDLGALLSSRMVASSQL